MGGPELCGDLRKKEMIQDLYGGFRRFNGNIENFPDFYGHQMIIGAYVIAS